MSIDAWAQVAIFTHFLFICGPGVVVMKIWDRLYLGRASRTKETLPDFHEWCRVTRYPRLFRRLTGCQRTPGFWGVIYIYIYLFIILEKYEQRVLKI